MSITSLIGQQNLTPKQKAILLFWQNTKGTYTKEPITVKDQLENYVPVYTDAELEKLIKNNSYNESLEFYQWDHFIHMMYLKDVLAQKYYYQMVGHLSTIVCGLPYMLLYGISESATRRLDTLRFSSPTLGEDVTYQQEVQKLYYCFFNFLMLTHTAMLMNLFVDKAYDSLPCLELLQKLQSVESVSADIMGGYMFGISYDKAKPTFPSTKEFYALHKERIIEDSITQFNHFTEPFARFDTHVPPSLQQKYVEEVDIVFENAFNPAP